MKKIETTTDGWDCVPELMKAVRLIEELGPDIYEIQNCVRQNDLEGMVRNMKDYLQEAIEWLDDVDTEQEFVTVDEN